MGAGLGMRRLVGLVLLCYIHGASAFADGEVRIAVLAFRPKAETLAQWQPTADYLSRTVPGRHFTMIPLGYAEIDRAIAARDVDFVLTNPSHYILMQSRHGLNRIATVIAEENGRQLSSFGGVVLVRGDNSAIQALADLKGKTIATPSMESLGGYQVQAMALAEAGVALPKDAHILATEMPHDRAVEALLQGRADAAFVRTGVMEAMTEEGKLPDGAVRVLAPRQVPGFPFAVTTRLYPEWPFSVLPHVDNDLARRVTAALLTMLPDSAAAKAGHYHGWTIPDDYEGVRVLLQTLRLPPFDALPHFTALDVARRYGAELAVGALLLLALVGLLLRLKLANWRLEEQKRQTAEGEARFRKAHGDMERLLYAAGEGIYGVDLQGRCTFINPAALRMLGYQREEVIGQDQHVLFHHHRPDGTNYPEIECPIYQTLQDGSLRQMEECFFRRDGTVFPVELIVSPVVEEGRLVGAMALFQDISERKAAEAALKQLNETLEQRVQEELAKNLEQESLLIQQSRLAAMGEMIGNIAHQWRQPINALGLLLSNLKDAQEYGELDPAFLDEQVDTGNRLIRNMSTTIDDFRDFFKPNKEKAPFGLRHSLAEVQSILGASLESHGIKMEIQGEEVMAFGYGNEFAQVLLNLLSNAKDAVIHSRVAPGRIRVDIGSEGGRAVLRVADNGGGIPADSLGKVFDPYFTTKEKGTGIGLYMSKLILEHMDGRIEARNTSDGAEFRVELPLA